MSESAIINCVEKIGKTVTASLGDAENENINNVCKGPVGHQTSYVENKSVSMTDRFVNGSRHMFPLPNGSEESLNENRNDPSVGFNNINPTQFPAKVTKSVPNVEELCSDLEIHHPNEICDSLKHSPSDASLKQTSANSFLDCNCDPNEKEDIEEPPNSPNSNTPIAEEKFCSDPMSKRTDPLCCVDHSDLENFNGEDKLRKKLSEATSTSGTSSKVDADHESIGDSDMIELPEHTDLSPNIHEKENDSSPNLIIQNGNATSREDSSLIEKYDEPFNLTEVGEEKSTKERESEIENTVEMIPASKLDTKLVTEEYEAIKNQGECKSLSEFQNPSEDSSKAQSPQVVDETPKTNVMPSREYEMESMVDTASFESARKQENSSSCQDSLPQTSEPDMKRVRETAPYSSEKEGDIDEVKMDVHETSDGSDKKQAVSPVYINLDNEVKPMDEEEEKKGMDLLKISKVESCTDVVGGINGSDKDEVKITDVNLQVEAKQEISDNPIEKIDSKEECKIVTTEELKKIDEELKNIDGDTLHPTKATETVEDKPTLKNDALVVEPASAMKISFKNILKKRESMETPKDSKQHESANPDPGETIVIDEVEAVPNVSRNLHGENNGAEEILRSEKTPTESTPAEKEDILSSDGESAKKRTFDSSTEVSEAFSPKRQRLDPVISELGDHIGVKSSEATTVIMDSDDDIVPSPQMSDKTANDENKMETNGRTVKLSGEMLRNLIKASMKSFMKNQVLEKEQLINERMKKMEAAIDLWRETAKHLEKSMNELTSYTKEFRKCKSQSVKLKHLASRTVAVQVSLNQNQPKTTNSSNHNRSTSLSLPPSVLRHPVPTQPGPSSNRPMTQSNGNMRPSQPTPRQAGPACPRGGLATPTGSQQLNRQRFPNMNQNPSMAQSQPSSSQLSHVMGPMANSHMVQQSGRAPASRPPNPLMNHASHSFQGSSSNMIDLTAEDDTSKQTKAATPVSQRAVGGSVPSPAVQNNAHNSSLARGPQPEINVVNSSNNQTVRSGGPGPSDKHNTSTKSVTGGSVQHVNNMIKVNGTSMGPSTSKSGVPVNNSSLTNGQAAIKTPPTELSSKAPGPSQPGTSASPRSLPPSVYVAQPTKHPASLPCEQYTKIVNTTKVPPPKPSLKISRVAQGIVLSWNMPAIPSNVANIASYQLFAYQETNSAPSPSLWKKVGDVKALPLPMACTLVQFQEGNKYYFAVRAIDQFGRWGKYSDPSSIYLFPK